MTTYYMHLLDNRPAEFCDGHIVYAGRAVRKLAKSLDQIRREQSANEIWSQRHKLQWLPEEYSYVRVTVSEREST